jgi:hypothetical protein
MESNITIRTVSDVPCDCQASGCGVHSQLYALTRPTGMVTSSMAASNMMRVLLMDTIMVTVVVLVLEGLWTNRTCAPLTRSWAACLLLKSTRAQSSLCGQPKQGPHLAVNPNSQSRDGHSWQTRQRLGIVNWD